MTHAAKTAPCPLAIEGIGAIALDAEDPQGLGRFYLQLLGGELHVDDEGDARLRSTSGGPPLDFLHVPEPHTVKNRLHLDVVAVDFDGAVEVALALGATRADDVYDGGRWQVLRDPEGNEFCILRPGETDGDTP
jgi:hypothetical protein